MSWRIDEVQLVGLAVVGDVLQGYRLSLDGDPPLALQVHGIEHLLRHFALAQAAAHLDEAIGDGRFPMIDVRDNGEVSDVAEIGHGGPSRGAGAYEKTELSDGKFRFGCEPTLPRPDYSGFTKPLKYSARRPGSGASLQIVCLPASNTGTS